LTHDTDFNHTLRLFIRNIPAETKVLDMGTGCGLVALEMARMGFDTTAIDCNPDMIEAAKKLSKEMDIDVDFKVDDVIDTELPERSFGLITARNCLWNLEDPMKAYSKWKSLLQPGG
jgi:2-polyprenyl-3-methyl-5-hydroxy-6-metoxy-1,4-benzoquinol methylase